MPLNLPDKLPAIELLKEENIFVIDTSRATQQDIRPLRIVILNLMPLKITTETDLVRLLSNTPLQVEISFMKIKSHTSKNTPIEHMQTFYTDFEQMRNEKYDGMIITGAPVEQMDFEEVTYWEEITEIFDWARTHVTSTLYICWAAQAGLYHHYGVPKYSLDQKMFGIFEHRVLEPFHSIFRGFDDCFYVPHSRHTEVRREDILKVPELTLLSLARFRMSSSFWFPQMPRPISTAKAVEILLMMPMFKFRRPPIWLWICSKEPISTRSTTS